MKKTSEPIDELRAVLKHPCNIAMLDYLSSYKVRRRVSIGGKPYLSFKGEQERDAMFLPLRKPGKPSPRLKCTEEMREFYMAFDGVRERKPPLSGCFLLCSEVPTVGEEFDADGFPGLQKYAQCPIIFSAANGDQLIQTSEGKFAWCLHEEDKLKKVADSFPRFLSKYISHRSVGDGRSFDSYGR